MARLQGDLDQVVESSGIAAPWFAVLHLLLSADDHRLPMSVLAREVSITSGGLTKMADRMARDGLIDRRGSAQDRRVVFAALTEQGEMVARRSAAVYVEQLRIAVRAVMPLDEFIRAADSLGPLALLAPAASGLEVTSGLDVDELTHDRVTPPQHPASGERRRPNPNED